MQHSVNYNLNKPDYSDQYDLRHWNDNTDIIDAQMKSEETLRIQGDNTLQTNINNEATARQNDCNNARDLTNATQILAVEHGGTGKNTKQLAIENLCEDLPLTSSLNDDDAVVFKRSNNVKKTSMTYLSEKMEALLKDTLDNLIPTGTILPYGGSSAPQGFLLCNGNAVSRITYAKLFQTIGVAFGAGDSINTFNLPDLRGRFPEGSNDNLGTRHDAGLPAPVIQSKTPSSYTFSGSTKTGGFVGGNVTSELPSPYGPFSRGEVANIYGSGGGRGIAYYNFNYTPEGNVSGGEHNHDVYTGVNTLYGKSDTVQPSAVCVNYIIKYI